MFSIFRSLFPSVLSALLVVFVFSGCESSINTPADEEFRLVQVPFSSDSKKQKDLSDDSSPYYCLVGTLNPEDNQFAYRYSAYYVHFPNGILNKAKREGKEDEWITLKYGNKNAIQRYEADAFDNGGLVRIAKCLIPGTEKAKELVAKQMKKFGKKSWVFKREIQKESSIETDTEKPSPVQTDWEWECYRWFVTEVCLANESGELYNCRITDRRCISYHLVYYEDGPSGGGGGPDPGGGGGGGDPTGGNDGDPCTEDGEQNGIPFKCYDEPVVLPLFMGEIVKDESLLQNQKANCVFDKLNQGATFSEVIGDFAGEHTEFDLVVEVDDLPDQNGTIRLGETSKTGNNEFTITLNSRYINSVPTLDLARTLLHEGIHAEMKRKIASVGGQISTKNFPGIYDYYTRYGAEGDWTHQQMAAHYLNTIIDGLKEFDNNQHSYQFYESIAWIGLKGTVSWNNLSSNERAQLDSEYQAFLSTGNKNCQ